MSDDHTAGAPAYDLTCPHCGSTAVVLISTGVGATEGPALPPLTPRRLFCGSCQEQENQGA